LGREVELLQDQYAALSPLVVRVVRSERVAKNSKARQTMDSDTPASSKGKSSSLAPIPESDSGGKKFTVFVIELTKGEHKWRVWRRYSQMYHLRARVKTMCHDIPFPKKKMLNLGQVQLDKRRRELERFLSMLLLQVQVQNQVAMLDPGSDNRAQAVQLADGWHAVSPEAKAVYKFLAVGAKRKQLLEYNRKRQHQSRMGSAIQPECLMGHPLKKVLVGSSASGDSQLCDNCGKQSIQEGRQSGVVSCLLQAQIPIDNTVPL
jgi:hypothetical protein